MTSADPSTHELRRSVLATRLARHVAPRLEGAPLRALVRRVIGLEGGAFWSATARELLRDRWSVDVAAYAYGACLRPGQLPPGVQVGRYVSMANEVAVFRRNHPSDRLSMHPFFYNSSIGAADAAHDVDDPPLAIEADAWIGHQAIVLPGCERIGLGAVVGAGTVVTRDVPDFAVVTGNPGQVKRLRFSDAVCHEVLQSRWWERSVDELRADPVDLGTALPADWRAHPLLQDAAPAA